MTAGIVSYRKREADANAEMERCKKASGQNMALRRKDLPALRDAANRWTDNCESPHATRASPSSHARTLCLGAQVSSCASTWSRR